MKLPSIQQIVQDSLQTFLRFPFVIINGVIGTVAAFLLVDIEGPVGETVLFNILLAAILGIPLLLGLALIGKKRKTGKIMSLGVQVIGVLLIIAYGFSVPSDLAGAPVVHVFRFFIIAFALHLFVAFIPYVSKGEQNGFWQFNKVLLLRAFITVLYSVVLYAGLAIALAALQNLFNINVPSKRYFELWIFISGIFTPWFFLAGMPENLDALEEVTEYPKGIKIFAQYILFPLVLIYLVILYTYMGKILIAWDWPRGWVSNLILGFSTTSILSLLLLSPISDRAENIWIRTASRFFYIILIPLIVMLFLAVWRRVSEYGITEGRYIVIVIAFWLAAMAAYFILSKTKSIKMIPASLCILSFLVSFGPWSAFDISENNQIERLRELLSKNSILVNGKIQKAKASVSFEDTKQMSSLLGYLHEVHGYDRIQPWFDESLKKDSSSVRTKDPEFVAKLIGITYSKVWQTTASNEFLFSADETAGITVSGYDRLLPTQHISSNNFKKDFPDEEISYRVNSGLDSLTYFMMREGKLCDSVQIDIHRFVHSLLNEYGKTNTGNIPPDKMSISSSNERLKIKLIFQKIHVRKQADDIHPTYYNVDVLYSKKPEL